MNSGKARRVPRIDDALAAGQHSGSSDNAEKLAHGPLTFALTGRGSRSDPKVRVERVVGPIIIVAHYFLSPFLLSQLHLIRA